MSGVSKERSCLLVPLYTDPQLPNYPDIVDGFGRFLTKAKDTTGLDIVVVDDGCDLTPKKLHDAVDRLISLPENLGKAQAVRHGFKKILELGYDFTVQYDGDGDQSFIDIPRLQSKVIEVAEGDPKNPVLIIGDRYSEELIVTPNPESVAYRQSLLILLGAMSNQMGYEGVRDWVSGARAMTSSYIEGFLERSIASRYGLESEELVTAFLMGAKVTTAPLTVSRPRDVDTLTSKWLQNFEVYDDHEGSLRGKGQDNLVDVAQTISNSLRSEVDRFAVDLHKIGEPTIMHFARLGDRYAANISPAYRSRIFVADAGFPFTIRKDETALEIS